MFATFYVQLRQGSVNCGQRAKRGLQSKNLRIASSKNILLKTFNIIFYDKKNLHSGS